MLLFGEAAVTALSISAGYILKTFQAARHYVKSVNTDAFSPGTRNQFFRPVAEKYVKKLAQKSKTERKAV